MVNLVPVIVSLLRRKVDQVWNKEMVETVKTDNSDDKTPQTVNNRFDWSAHVGEQNQETPQEQQGKESNNQNSQSGNIEETEADLEHLDNNALKIIQELFGENLINVQQPKAIFITKLEKALGGKIPPQIFSEPVDGKIILHHIH